MPPFIETIVDIMLFSIAIISFGATLASAFDSKAKAIEGIVLLILCMTFSFLTVVHVVHSHQPPSTCATQLAPQAEATQPNTQSLTNNPTTP